MAFRPHPNVCIKETPPPPRVHVLGDFNFGDIVWPDRLNKSGSPLSSSEGEILIEIMNDYGLEQLVHFPTRERNTLDLIITSLPGQFVDIHSPDRLSDHDIVSGTLKVVIPPIKKPKRKVYLNLNLNSLLVKRQIDNPSPGAVTGGN